MLSARRQADNDVFVTVRGVPITTTKFYRKLEAQIGKQVIVKMVSDTLESKFAESLGAIPTQDKVEESARQRELTPGWDEFATAHHISHEDVRQICWSKLARELAIDICNAKGGAQDGGNSMGTVSTSAAESRHAVGSLRSTRYVERFAEYRKTAHIQVLASEYAADITGHGDGR